MRALTTSCTLIAQRPQRYHHVDIARRARTLANDTGHNLQRLADLFSAEELSRRQQRVEMRRATASGNVTVLQPERCTPGALVPVDYLSGTNAISVWEPFFAEVYETRLASCATAAPAAHVSASSALAHATPTVPLYQCLFCSAQATSHRGGGCDKAEFDACSDAKPATSTARQWRTPLNMCTHLSSCHACRGVDAVELRPHNEDVIRRIVAGVLDRSDHQDRLPFRAIVLVDTANMELGCPDVFFELMRSVLATSRFVSPSLGTRLSDSPNTLASRDEALFLDFPMAFCNVHELFIPHTAKVTHAVYQLAQAHRHSDFFTIYAPSRLEAGDLTTAWVISALKDAFSQADPKGFTQTCPPIVVLTMDAQQKRCLQELFGEGMPTLGVSDGPVLCPRFVNVASTLHTLREAVDGASLV